MTEEKEEYELENRWIKRIRGLEGAVVIIILFGFLMFFCGFLLGVFFMAAGG